jgi:predicted HTH transcriptional regulator
MMACTFWFEGSSRQEACESKSQFIDPRFFIFPAGYIVFGTETTALSHVVLQVWKICEMPGLILCFEVNRYEKKFSAVSSYIKKLIAQGEHQQQDFKFEISDSKKIARSLAAFSNTDGGRLLVGVKDNGAIAGVRSEEEFYMVEAAAEMYCKPPVRFKMKEWVVDGKTILEIDIPKNSSQRPFSAPDKEGKWKAYIRVNDQNLLANTVLLKVWRMSRRSKGITIRYTDKEKILLDYLDKNEAVSISRFRKIAGISRQVAEKVLVDLITLKIIDIFITEKTALYRANPKFAAEYYVKESSVSKF